MQIKIPIYITVSADNELEAYKYIQELSWDIQTSENKVVSVIIQDDVDSEFYSLS